MSSRQEYKKKFEELFEIEKKARNLYKYYVDRLNDPHLLEKFTEIYHDEEKHMKIAQELIDLTTQ